LHFLVEPGATTGLLQLVDHAWENRREMRDVGNRIVDLALVERTAAPVGEARTLVEAVAEERLDEIRISDLFAMPQRRGGDLGVEQGMGDLAGEIMDDFEVLTARVEDLEDLFVGDEQVEEGFKVYSLGLGIDGRGLHGRCDLDQA